MSGLTIEFRCCTSCGLRYPITQGHGFGIRCPHCLGATEIARTSTIHTEAMVREKPLKKAGAARAILLDNIRSAWNVGSILRSADGFGFEHAYLCGITPSPENEAVTKTSLGAEDYVTWSEHKDAVKLVKGLKKEGWKIFAL
ncbi:MAG TPA: TrmH family RNA methyltransferase, partial [Anaerolineales bacterium]|nr:TrmH family RNA methyltransferase [Anaerolineales bacterium]